MSTLEFRKGRILAAALNGESTLPPIAGMTNAQQHTKSVLDEDDGLYIGYGFLSSSFPYRLQDMYDRKLQQIEVDCAVLENQHLRALFLPEYGGRLWSLYDKDAGKELTFSNPVIRPGNLAIRNAWLSGGVEWNCGMVGHHPYTCSPLFTAKTQLADGTPVLRMYEFERIRRAVYQMDFFLPDDSKMLFARMRIVNPNAETVPMYWWSNIAVPEKADGRVVMSTNETFTNRNNMVSKTTVPISNGIDITYPVNNPTAVDFFWKIPQNNRKYVCQIDKSGYGLIETSTSRLKGRKLFVWGQGPGGDHWQEFLSGEGNLGRYAEIQCGIAHTQYENLPMPPKTAWEWLEAYGALNADGEKVHGDWEGAKTEVERALNGMITEDTLETMLNDTRAMAKSPAAEMLRIGGGWGALERMRRALQGEPDFCEHLNFGDIGDEQRVWANYLENGYLAPLRPENPPGSFMLQPEWTRMLEETTLSSDLHNWFAHLQLGLIRFVNRDMRGARESFDASMHLKPTAWAIYGLANIERLTGKPERAAMLTLRAASVKPDDPSLAKEAMKMLVATKQYRQAISCAEKMPESVAQLPRVKLTLAFAHLNVGDFVKAEELLNADGGIDVPDIREGENSVTDLWFQVEEAKATSRGETFDRVNAHPPKHLDFRMGAKKRQG